jgi:hypothetical protein
MANRVYKRFAENSRHAQSSNRILDGAPKCTYGGNTESVLVELSFFECSNRYFAQPPENALIKSADVLSHAGPPI